MRNGRVDGGAPIPPALIVTNFNRNFTGVSATAAAVTRALAGRIDLRLCGAALPGCPAPVGRVAALLLSRRPPAGRDFVVWHVRRNSEMQLALFARDVLRLPVRIVFTSAAQRRHSAWPRGLISRMDAVVATTRIAASFVPNVTAVIPHGVDTAWFRPVPDRARAWRDTGFPGDAGVATVGRIRPEKGTDRFVDAMISVLPQRPGVTALVIGAATAAHAAFEARLRQKVAAAGLAGRILFVGEMPAERLRDLYSALSLLVALPRYEGYGMTVLEAMASGVPVVAADAGAFGEMIEEDVTGRVAGQDDMEGATRAIARYLDDGALVESHGENARARTVERFGLAGEAEALAGIYRRLGVSGSGGFDAG